MTELERLVDYCATNGASEYDVARVVAAHDYLHASHRYADNGWEVLEDGEWKLDGKGANMGHTVMQVVSQACNERALYWQNKLMKGDTRDPAFDELRVMALIELVLKFRDKTFLRGVVSECKAFFE